MNCILLDMHELAGDKGLVPLTGRRADHIRDVLRANAGDTLRVGVLNGRIGSARLVSIDKNEAVLDVLLDRPPPPPSLVTLICALPRPKSMRKVVHAATVMGVKNLYFIESWKVDKSYWQTPWLEPGYLRELVILALEQAVDTVLPSIHQKRRFKPFVEDELPAIALGSRVLAAHPGADSTCPRGVDGPTILAIGPEGGFTQYEVESLQARGFQAVSIGERILRVDEAVPAILGRLS